MNNTTIEKIAATICTHVVKDIIETTNSVISSVVKLPEYIDFYLDLSESFSFIYMTVINIFLFKIIKIYLYLILNSR